MIDGGLFTRDFLIEGIVATKQWISLETTRVEPIKLRVASQLSKLMAIKNPSEAVTEKDLIYPVLAAIGWNDLVFVQPNASVKGRADVPDALLFADEQANDRARCESDDWKRFQHGLCIVEAKRWNRILDREEKTARADDGVPSTQMLRYLRRVDDVTNGKLRWGILTNGRIWRLYWKGALSTAEGFLEIDLGKVLGLPGCEADLLDKRPAIFTDDQAWRDHVFKLFVLLFGREAFLPFEAGQTFHEYALKEGKFWEARVAKSLAAKVFDQIFPTLADALAKADPQRDPSLSQSYLEEVRQGALILLYRLLFVLYAEDRNLLPDESGAYADYCLTRMRLDIAERKSAGKAISTSFVTYWPKLASIFRAIADGDDSLGIPPYNGGLFDPKGAPILARVQLPDAIVAEMIFGLSHEKSDASERGPKYINYRDLSVQQLGSVYERILEFGLRANSDGRIEIDADDEARHESGSYYTPEELVSLIIGRAIGPLVAESHAAFAASAEQLGAQKAGSMESRLQKLAALDPAAAILSLKICDPAMGSGHFLVSLVDWLADEVLDAMAEASALVKWGAYVSPLAERIAAVRGKILAEAKAHNWPIVESQLDDRHVVRRMVLKRVVHGVDKNPMAVELAKVSLWLHSFTVGAPLSLLDHHLRAGDSIMGAWVRPSVDGLKARGALFNLGQIARVEQVAGLMAEIEQTTDNDIAEVNASKEKFGLVEDATQPVAALFSLLTAEKLMGVFDEAPKKAPDFRKLEGKPEKQMAKARADQKAFDRAAALQLVLEGTFGDPIRIASGADRVAPPELVKQLALLPETPSDQASLFPSISVDDRRRVIADSLVAEAKSLDSSHHFFHWEIGFPNIWSNLTSNEPEGGFDAVIGNPPYVRQELLGDQVKRGLKKNYAAYDGMADLYVYFYEQGLKLLKPGGRMSYVVTNKWLKAGYAEALRGLFASKAWLEFVADFGHAKHFFPDADVFPSVLVVRKPERNAPAPAEAQVCVIPREAVPRKGLSEAVVDATFPLPRAMFSKESWVLEPKPVMDLLEKIRRNGMPLAEYAGVKPLYGIKTGLNEAFLIDTPKRDELIRADPSCTDIIKPFLRGQDIERWSASWNGLWMIFAKRGIDINRFPSVKRHLEGYRKQLEPKPINWEPSRTNEKWLGRKEGAYAWYEIQDPVDYWAEFQKPKLLIKRIEFYADWALDLKPFHVNDSALILPTTDKWLLATANGPAAWYFRFRRFPHKKDEAIAMDIPYVETMPIARKSVEAEESAENRVHSLVLERQSRIALSTAILDWLRHEFGLEKPGTALAQPHQLDADGFVAAVRKALPKSRKLSAAEIGRLKQEHADTIEPTRRAAAEALVLERQLSDLVNAAYGLTPEDVQLMWATAPPRMPFAPSAANPPA